MKMRRSDREITDPEEISEILEKAQVCRVAFSCNDEPYIVPMNFGFKDNHLYLHSAQEGRKISILHRNNRVCFEVDIETELVKSDRPCNWGMEYRSVVGYGAAVFIEDPTEKKGILDIIMKKYSHEKHHEYDENILKNVAIIKVHLEDMKAKGRI